MSHPAKRLARLVLMVVAFMVGAIAVVLLPGCAERELGYDPMARRPVCHLRYHRCEWYGQDIDHAIWAAYRYHIGRHPKDYWGPCRPEDIRDIPLEQKPRRARTEEPDGRSTRYR